MKISLNWLKDYIDLSGLSADEISSTLTMAGLEVEDVYNQAELLKGFVVGYIKEKGKHPNADKLSLCKVFDGNEELQIVCGAPNVAEGQKVVLAKIGAIVPNGGFAISKAKLRGIESFGMLCSESELQLSEDHSGIMVLDEKIEPGTPVSSALGLDDVIFEIGITPNRPDALSHLGVARDLAALFNKKIKTAKPEINYNDTDINSQISIVIEDSKNCPRYSAMVVNNVEVKESPEWLKKRLKLIGLRPINNIVDITNYVMFETGQPLHAFDLDKLAGSKIVVSSSKSVTKFTTLDSKEREVPAGSLYINDADKPLAVAGVMGGENSEISSETKNILIESAYFNPSSIRKTSKSLGLSTDASYRFERGTNFDGTLYAAQRTAQLVTELTKSQASKGYIDIYPQVIEHTKVVLRFSRVKKILGYDVPAEKVKEILQNLGFEILSNNSESIEVKVPGYRPDVEREIDLIEEIARIFGYDNIPTIEKISVSLGKKVDELKHVDDSKTILTGLGFYEIINNPLVSDNIASFMGNKIALLNPLSAEMSYLRTSLIPGALNTVSLNVKVGEKDLQLFEIGNVFNKKLESNEITSFSDYTETTNILFLVSGNQSVKGWNSKEFLSDFYSLKSKLETYFIKLGLENKITYEWYDKENNVFDYYFEIKNNEEFVGYGGKIKDKVLEFFDIKQSVYCAEIILDKIKDIKIEKKKYEEVLKYPKIMRDFAFVFDKTISYDEVLNFIKNENTKLLKDVQLFDLFENESLGDNKKSMAFSLEYFEKDRTLREEEVEKEFEYLIKAITSKFNAKLRG